MFKLYINYLLSRNVSIIQQRFPHSIYATFRQCFWNCQNLFRNSVSGSGAGKIGYENAELFQISPISVRFHRHPWITEIQRILLNFEFSIFYKYVLGILSGLSAGIAFPIFSENNSRGAVSDRLFYTSTLFRISLRLIA